MGLLWPCGSLVGLRVSCGLVGLWVSCGLVALLCRLTQGSTRLARRCAGSAADGRKAAGLAVQAGLAFGTQSGRTAGAFLPTVLHGDVRLCSSHSSRMSAARMTLAVPSLHSLLYDLETATTAIV